MNSIFSLKMGEDIQTLTSIWDQVLLLCQPGSIAPISPDKRKGLTTSMVQLCQTWLPEQSRIRKNTSKTGRPFDCHHSGGAKRTNSRCA